MTEVIYRSFASGEITPSLYARVDQVKYATGLRTCRNFIVKRHGGAQNRPGTKFIAETKIPGDEVRLIPFIFNNDQTYVLEFGHLYMRVYRNAIQLTDTLSTITAITNANPGVVTTSAAHGLSNGQEVQISGVTGMREVNNRNFKVNNVTGTTFELQDMTSTNLDTSGYGTFTLGGTAARVFEIVTPYAKADLMALRYAQSADIINITHPNYAPRELQRTGHTSWAIALIVLEPTIDPPTGAATNNPGATVLNNYFVTALDDFGEESVISNVATTNVAATTTVPVTITWNAVAGANGYNIYRDFVSSGGLFGEGYIGTSAKALRFDDLAITPEFERSYPVNDNPFGSANNYPTAVTYYQSRLCFANTNNFPETAWMSHSGSFKNFSIPFPSTAASRVVFTMAGRQVNSIQHMIDIGRLIMFTASGEWGIQGNDAGIITPADINPIQSSYNGAGQIPPIVSNGNALYVQARGTVVRDLLFTVEVGGYSGNDLSLFSSHLFDDFTLIDWDYQKIPDSNIWIVRSDGQVLCLTYVREQDITGWSRHDFDDGFVERVTAVPEGNEDTVYFVIKRTIEGVEKRYIEKFSTRKFVNIEDISIVDSSLSFDGRNLTTNTMTLSGGTTWEYDETLTLTHSSGFFIADDVGNQIFLYDSTGNIIRFTIEAYSSATVVTGKPHKTVPLSLRSVAVTEWSLAVDMLEGLWHIEGKQVSVFGDGFVVGSPKNPAYTTFTVNNGAITLDKPFSVIHVGLPITADIETLDLDTTEGEPLGDKHQNITRVAIHMEESRGLWAGEAPPSDDDTDPLEDLTEMKPRKNENQDLPPDLKTEVDFINIKGRWNQGGRIFIRQIDPLPATIIGIIPGGYVPLSTGRST